MRRLAMVVGLPAVLALLIVGVAAGNVAVASPTLPTISGLYSPSHPDPAKWYPHRCVSLAWTPLPGVPGYSYILDQNPTTMPDGQLDLSNAPGFAPTVRYATDAGPCAIAAADFNGDGSPDLAVLANGDSNAYPFPGRLSIWLNDRSGGFVRGADFATGAIPAAIAAGDVNGDGKQDVVIANYGGDTVSVFLGDGTGQLGAARDEHTGAGPYAVAIADMNGDGKADLVTANADGDSVSVLLGDGSGGFAAKADHATGERPLSLAVADFNRDGAPDVATANAFGYSVTVLLGSGSGAFASRKDYRTAWFADSIAAGDLNGDGIPDVAYAADDKVSVRFGDGKGGFGAAATYSTGAGAETVAIGDVNADSHADLVVSTGAGNALSVLPGDGSGRFATGTQFPAEPHATDNEDSESLALADFNGDGRTDVAFSNDRLGRLYTYRSELGARVAATADGVWYLHLGAADGLGGVGPARTIAVRIDTTRPTTTARPASVKRGRVARLRCAVRDAEPCAGWARVQVVVKNSHGKIVRRVTLSHRSLGWFSAAFRCGLAKGTYRYHVHATDAAGNSQVKVAWNRLVVR